MQFAKPLTNGCKICQGEREKRLIPGADVNGVHYRCRRRRGKTNRLNTARLGEKESLGQHRFSLERIRVIVTEEPKGSRGHREGEGGK